MCKRGFATMAESLEKSSPATMALAKRTGGSSLMKSMATSTLKTSWAATDSLNAMLSMAQKKNAPEQPKVEVEEEEDFGFPSIAWLDEDSTSETPVSLLNDALDIVHDFDAPKPAAKRRRMGEPQGMVRSKALKSDLSSLINTSCSKEATKPVNTTTKFVLPGAWGSMVANKNINSLATLSLKSSPFVHTPTIKSLLTV